MSNMSIETRDRRSVVVQLRDALRDLIEEMEPGERLPSENELVARFGVARGTIRESLKLIEQDGLVDVQHGRGRFVSAVADLGVNRPITNFEGVTEMLRALGFAPRTRLLLAQLDGADETEATALGIAPGEQVVRLARLRTNKRQPLVLSINAFRADLLGEETVAQQDFSGSLHVWLSARGAEPISSAARFQAVPLPADYAGVVGEPAASGAWLLTSERCFDATGAVVLFSRDYHRGDVFSFHVVRRRAD
jgi:GntR family transcriptional regulator